MLVTYSASTGMSTSSVEVVDEDEAVKRAVKVVKASISVVFVLEGGGGVRLGGWVRRAEAVGWRDPLDIDSPALYNPTWSQL